jgi:pyruvate dehydrogenase E2 component (dihydrolipoyllysine-residue acetyltransferase)
MAEFVMPSLGADMEAGTLVAWLKKPGEKVNRGDVIAEIDTDKGVIEVECFSPGIVEKLLIEPGEKVPVGTALAVIREERETTKPAIETTAQVSPPITTAPPESKDVIATPEVAEPETARQRISPAARKLAEELNIDLTQVIGSGPHGRLIREDIERAAAARKAETAAPPETTAERQGQMSRQMSLRMR